MHVSRLRAWRRQSSSTVLTWRRRSRSHSAVLRSWTRLLTCPLICVYRCLTWSRQCRKRGIRRCSSWTRLPVVCKTEVQTVQNPVEFTQVHFLDRVYMPATTGAGMVLTAQKTVESPQLALTFGQGCRRARVGHVKGLSRFRSCSSSTGVSAHHGDDELMRRLVEGSDFLGPCAQAHGQG